MRHASSLLRRASSQSHSTQRLPRYARNDVVEHLAMTSLRQRHCEEARRSNLMNIKRLFHHVNI